MLQYEKQEMSGVRDWEVIENWHLVMI
jgi:hypothetical protein